MESAKALFTFALLIVLAAETSAVPVITDLSTRIVYLDEEVPEDTHVQTVTGLNPDGGSFTFGLQSETDSSLFKIRTVGSAGIVEVETPPDREMFPDGATFEITIMDSMGAVQPGTVTVIVILRDINDNAPTWQNPPANDTVPLDEFDPVGTRVLIMNVQDLDQGQNSIVRHRLVEPLDGTFDITELTGIITLRRALSFFGTQTYTVVVSLTDGGAVPMSTIVNFTVQVVDEIDPPPEFTQSLYFPAPITENDYSMGTGVRVVRTRAIAGSDLLARIEYSGGFPTLFEVRSILDTGVWYGDVFAIGNVDYETATTFSFTVSAVRVANNDPTVVHSLDGIASVSVTIEDRDDNDPVFLLSHYVASISESTPIGVTVISNVEAFDIDSGNNAAFQYSIQSNGAFDIEPLSGEIYTTAQFETDGPSATSSYNFEIYAIETSVVGNPAGTGVATVAISILDENDNSPEFAEDLYIFEVREDQAPGILTSTTPNGLTVVEAIDADSGTNAAIRYSLVGPDIGTKFRNSSDGVIETLMMLDRDADVEEYYLTLIAEDGGSPTNRDSTLIIIRVLDINDNPPVFNPDMYSLTLLEGETYPDFLTVVARDLDETGTNGAPFTYRIERNDTSYPTDVSTQFTINNDGSMTATNLVHNANDPMANIYTLIVIATDSGTDPMPLSGTATVVVTIQDANTDNPVFDPATYSTMINESHVVNTPIGITVSATDPELHNIRYFIQSQASPTDDSEFFTVDETSGSISLVHELDYEAGHTALTFNIPTIDFGRLAGIGKKTLFATLPAENHQSVIEHRKQSFLPITANRPRAIVLAIDDASPPLTGTALVTVDVVNVNDNDPVITNPSGSGPFTYNIQESSDTNDTIRSQFIVVTATDEDNDPSDEGLSYTLTQTPAAPPAYFTLDEPTSGRILQSIELDRETHASITLTVQVCDEGLQCDSVDLVITVTDINDNAPSFINTPYAVTILENVQGGTSLITVEAEDMADEGSNAVVEYSISGTDLRYFTIEAATGLISLVPGGIDLETENQNTFMVTVEATDNPGGTDRLSAMTVTLTVTVEDYNDIPPVFGSSTYSFSIVDNTTGPVNVFTGVNSTDDDFAIGNRAVSYELDISRTLGWLDIDAMGNIYIVSGEVVDREDSGLNVDSDGRGILNFDILAINEGPGMSMPDLTATATVMVTILDINDNAPVIAGADTVNIDVVEHSPLGSILAVFSATDADVGSNAEIEFSITSGDTSVFSITADGVLTIEADVDEETDTSFSLIVTATNPSGGTLLSDSVDVTVTLIEANDFNPVFMLERYSTAIREYNAVTGTGGMTRVIGEVFATDNDTTATAAGQLEYYITGGNQRGIFDIVNPASGSVSVVNATMVDYETDQQFDLIITATDTVMPTNERRVGSTHFLVTVVDENDNSPQFLDSNYTGFVIEEEDGATVIVVPSIRTDDPDTLDGTEEVTVTITDQLPELAFVMNSDGSIVTDRPIDREAFPDGFTLELTAGDMASNTATATLMITINDINDSPPIIDQTASDLSIDVPENQDVNSTIRTVTAQDDDISPNNVFTFSLSGDRDFFEINQNTGIITLIRTLDRETIPTYTLTVTTVDGARNSRSVSFTITVTDANDNEPVFTMPVFIGSVHEHVDNGTLLSLFITATDLDGNSIEYSIVTPGVPFGIIPNTGQIYTLGDTTAIDREIDDFYDFLVQADDGLLRMTIPEALVEITVLDINDNNPVFTSDEYENDLFEGTQGGVVILQVHADDADIGSNADIEYSISSVTPPSVASHFAIESTSGDISTTVDFTISTDTPPNATIEVLATDRGSSDQLTDTALVVLQLLDRNSAPPEFSMPNYNCSVVEEVENQVVCTVLAEETDVDRVNEITYSVVTDVMFFNINSLTGTITTAVGLDRERVDLYTVTVAAADNPLNGDPSRTGIATVTVHILDTNDNDPYFDPEEYPIGISESTSVNSTVLRVLAFDDDIGMNAELTLQIASGDTNVFGITNDGVIMTKMELNREAVPFYELIVVAQDNGMPTMQGNATVTIHILDENDNSPVFTNGSLMDVAIMEGDYSGNTGGVLLTRVIAVDLDDDFNQVLAYSFNNNSQVREPFYIDRNTGEITVRGEVDREEEDLYELTITAADQRGTGPQVRRTTAVLRVHILDINDNIPFFNLLTLDYSIPEDLVQNLVFGRVQGGDRDVDANAELFFHLLGNISNTTCFDAFCINQRSGELFLNAEVDRETQDIYVLQMAVSNSPVLTFNSSSSTPDAASTTSVTVRITDVNDEPPVFVPETLLAAVAEEAEFGTTVTTLRTSDQDIGNGQVARYEITTPAVPFLVVRDTGVVTSSGIFRGASGTKYEITVRATDNLGAPPSISTTATMTVYVFKTIEQLIFTFGVSTTIIEDKLDNIESNLTAITNSRIIINEVRVFQTDSGSVDITRTDVILFVLNAETGEVQPPQETIRLIDQNFAAVDEAFSECDLQEVKIHPPPPTDRGGIPAYVWAIVAILAALICSFCCCFLCIFVVEKRRYRKVKKRTELESYQSQLSNANAVSNPLWIAPYDNWDEETSTVDQTASQLDRDNPVYESQELTIEMFQDDYDDDIQSTTSSKKLLKAPPLTSSTPGRHVATGRQQAAYSGAYDDELLAEAIGEPKKGYGYDSETSLISDI